ncbi:hypothetical protein SAMN05216193_101434 [Pseudomonas jinjuensis]|uniref:Uncharacterized protein n=1 Tax=Pseudomonas jinjuensis TaxID=198616 RepID=A0A1G9ZBL4_9PSED|nr:hypothetical protein SAMN05216193_101434 [Pseudomonas jinjuensis]
MPATGHAIAGMARSYRVRIPWIFNRKKSPTSRSIGTWGLKRS